METTEEVRDLAPGDLVMSPRRDKVLGMIVSVAHGLQGLTYMVEWFYGKPKAIRLSKYQKRDVEIYRFRYLQYRNTLL